ncbi:thiol-disulfide oxidoreductase [Stieleria maiorica]|uniref:Thiol-disulfide oxidoreductase n=1 Tax=Stieleria maiorica TaxID=2795974 RepID=A0A5B9MS74_9BACT|nr:redoxin domain-containing protein [Stieleria maiorica]QEG02686.1 thiol-disulfide oxidoreductase [Stieleria maiorica]
MMKLQKRIPLSAACFALLLGSLVQPSPADEPVASPALGKRLTRIDLDGHRGRRWQLEDFQQDSHLVVAFLGTECPLAKLYAVRLQSMHKTLADKGVRVIGVMSNRHDSLLDISAFAQRQSLTFPIVKDAGGRLADDLGATRTPEVFVFDDQRRLRYRGRVDDQYGIGYVRDNPRRNDLREAIDELLAGTEVSVPRTEAVGCIIGRKKDVQTDAAVTYGGQIAAILNRHCVECHREGEIAPFALTEYEEVAGWADMIAEVVRDQRMPPWHADPEHGKFANARRLSDEEKQLLYDWAQAGAPAGDLSNLPVPPAKVAGWQLPRQPDLVFNVSSQPFEVPAEGAVRYQYFRVDPKLDHDVWVEAAELKPGNRSVVHHILAFAVPKGQRRGLDGARGFLVGYVPGARVEPWPAGHAKRIPAGSELIFQVHYTPIGTAATDQSELGICLVDEATVTHEIVTTSAVQTRFAIPPGDADHPVAAVSPEFPADAKLLSMSPHMHVRGKSFEYAIKSTSEVLLSIPHYDFNWQTTYVLKQPLPLEAGDRIECRAVFDNSAANLNNPDPSKTVKWGDQTWDEMMIGYYHLSVPRDRDDSGPTTAERRRAAVERAVRLATFDRIDRDKDGKLTKAQTPRKLHKVFDDLDADGDGVLTRQEAETQ